MTTKEAPEYIPPGAKLAAPDDDAEDSEEGGDENDDDEIAQLQDAVSDLAEMVETIGSVLADLAALLARHIDERADKRFLQKIGREADKLVEDAQELQEDFDDE